ncbi:MAG: antitoxin Xre/MbcA/ParS toxin-binding domain-containing protein [Janthinobacterium lividum]
MTHDPAPATPSRRRQAARPATVALSYIGVFRAEPVQRIAMAKAGLPAADARRIVADLAANQAAGYRALGISPATMNRKIRSNDRLPLAESERVIGVARLVGQLQAIVEESGNPAGFDAPAWLSRWLGEPLPALGGVRPLDMLDTIEGQGLVSASLARIQAGAYA